MTTSDEDAPPRELVVDAQPAPGDSSDGSGSAMAPIVVTVLVAGGLAKLVSLTAAGVALGAAVIFYIMRRKPSHGRFVLRMHDSDVLEVTREDKGAFITRVPLVDLIDVTLDRETRAAGTRGGTAERVRLALERRAPAEPIFVPDERITPIEAQEWYSKVRVFLRKHGWVPHQERASEEALR